LFLTFHKFIHGVVDAQNIHLIPFFTEKNNILWLPISIWIVKEDHLDERMKNDTGIRHSKQLFFRRCQWIISLTFQLFFHYQKTCLKNQHRLRALRDAKRSEDKKGHPRIDFFGPGFF